MINRIIDLPAKRSFFLLGPRQTGKSTLIDARFPRSLWKINLLETDQMLKYSKDPALFRREAVRKIRSHKIERIFIDEIQKVPALLDEIQGLMAEFPIQFILTGSSARKLKRGQANLLAGRAVARYLFPFVYGEIRDDFDLNRALRFGTLPSVFGEKQENQTDILKAYTHIYLKDEIQSEGIARNLGGFSRFLDMAGSQSGELVSFSAIARECQLPVRTVQSYYEVLEDTLIGFRLEPWHKSVRKRLVAHPKFYFFDSGVTNAMNGMLGAEMNPALKGRLFEQWIILETYRMLHYLQSEARLFFWRTNHGAEIDLLVEKHGRLLRAFEIKSSPHLSGAALSGIRAFQEDHKGIPCQVISTVQNPYELSGVSVISWQDYLEELPGLL